MATGTELLLTCLRKEEEETKLIKLRSYKEEDWEIVIEAASKQAVLPILHHILKPLYPSLQIPDHLTDKMQNIYYHSAARNMRLFRQLLQLLSQLNDKNIPVVPLKGAYLAEKVYHNIALRPMVDIDLLVKREDIAAVDKILVENGYSCSENNLGCAMEHLAPYYKDSAIRVEVHFHITEPPISERFEIEDLWKRARKESIQDVEISALCPEDIMLHLCSHTCLHHTFDNGILPFIDLSKTADHFADEINWEKLIGRGQEWGLERCISLMLLLAEKMVGLSMPENIKKAEKLDLNTLEAVTAAEYLIDQESGGVSQFVSRLFGERKGHAKPGLFLQRLFPAKESMIADSNPNDIWFIKLYCLYLVRITQLFKKHGKIMWLGLRRDPETIKAIQIQNKRNELKDWLIQDI